jgi:hypothetical protein
MPEPKQLRHVKHLKSNVIQSSGKPKVPDSDKLGYGEIAINYAEGVETISLKNSNNQITKFTPNTNVYVKSFKTAISTKSVCDVLTAGTVYKYQNFDITFLGACNDDFDLFDIIDYIRNNFYDECDLHIMLNAVKSSNQCERTCFYIDSEDMQTITGNDESGLDEGEISDKSTIIGFYRQGAKFIAGDSDAINGIEIDWDCTNKAITVKLAYIESAYRLNGDEI